MKSLLFTVLLLAPVPADTGVLLPAEQRGEVTAQLSVLVPEQAAAPGLAQAVLTLTVEGPAGLEIDGPRLEDALDGWRRAWQASSWREDGGRCRVEVRARLVQVKAGVMPLPGVTLRVRPGPSAAWQEVAWPDLLQEPRDVPPPIGLPPLPPSPWPARAQWLAVALAVALLVPFGLAAWRRWLSRRHRLTPAQSAISALRAPVSGDGTAVLAHIAGVLRQYVEAQAGVPATRLTTGELVAALEQRGGLSSPTIQSLGSALQRCDQAKFAGRELAAEEGQSAREEAMALIDTLAGQLAKEGGVGEPGKIAEGG